MIPGITASQPAILTTTAPELSGQIVTVGRPPLQYQTFQTTIKNLDVDTATMYGDDGTNPPTTSRGTAAYNASVSGPQGSPQLGGTIYARAKASSKDYSSVVSISY